jgi:hypothetical protein
MRIGPLLETDTLVAIIASVTPRDARR